MRKTIFFQRRSYLIFIFLFNFFGFFVIPSAHAQVVINELGIAPTTGDAAGGGEFIEFYNKGGCNGAIDISCYVLIYSGTSGGGNATAFTITIPAGTVMPACSYYLIGGSGTTPLSTWTSLPIGGNPWINNYGANGRAVDLDISNSYNSGTQSLRPGNLVNTKGQVSLYTAAGVLVASVSYNSGNNAASYTGSFSNPPAGCTALSPVLNPGASPNDVVGTFSSVSTQGIYLSAAGTYLTETDMTPGKSNALNGGTQSCCNPTITTAAAAADVCFKLTAQTTTLAYSATTNTPTTYSITWNAAPANSFVAVTNAPLPASPITINVPAGTPAGLYTGNITVANAGGCSSCTKTFTVRVKAASTSTTNASVCNNHLPFVWNGNNYNTSGTYTVTLINAAGCDSVATLILLVKATSTSTTNASVCNNHLPYVWNGNNYNTSGTYTVTLINAAGCDSVATLILLVKATSTSTTNASVCNNHLPYVWNGNNYNTSGTYTVTLINAAGCDSVATLILLVKATSSSTTNISVCSFPYTWNGNVYNASGTYIVTLVNAAGCDSLATLVLTLGGNTSSTTNASVCSNHLPYVWNGNNYNTSGTYSVTIVVPGYCDSIATLILTVKNTSTSTSNASVCNNQLPYVWNGNNYNASGTFTVTLINAAGCDSVATLNLLVKATSTSTTNASVCNNHLPYVWNGNNYNASGTYTVTLINAAGCDSVATLNLLVKATSTSTTNASVCNNHLPYVWNGNNYNASGTFTVTLINAAGCDSVASLILQVNTTSTSSTNASVCNNHLPFVWNGNNYNSSGTYTVTLVNGAGCDSVATLILLVKATSASTSNASVCSNLLPYVWNGNNYNASGTYTVTLVNAAGCDSVTTLNLLVKATSASTSNASICSNLLPYVWNGNNYNASGTYSVTFINSVGCDSVATLILLVKATTSSTTNASVCNNHLPYVWNGNNYNTSGTYSVTLINAAGCDSVATLNLQVNSTTNSTTNASVCSNLLPYVWNGNNYNASGTYTVTLVNGSGCDSVATLNLLVKATSASTTNAAVCNNLLPYVWNGNNYNASGTYTVTLLNSVGCDSVATLNLQVKLTTTSTSNASICSNLLPYVWNGNNYNASGTYSITFVNSAGCDSIATLNLLVKSTSSSSTNKAICSASLPYIWNGNSYNTAGTYSVVLVNAGGCDSTATLVLTISSSTVSSTGITVCNKNLPYRWNGNNYNAAGVYTVTLVNAVGCDSIATLILGVISGSSSTTNTTICSSVLPYSWNGRLYNATGNYSVTLVNAAGCDSVANLALTVKQVVSPSPFLGIDTSLCPMESLVLYPGLYDSYLWQNASTLPRLTITQAGYYSVTVNNLNTCPQAVGIRVNYYTDCDDIYFPGAITPNGDGRNDKFGALGNLGAITDYSLYIYNKYGELVFTTRDPLERWDGMYKNKLTGNTSYVWYAKYLLNRRVSKMQKGNLILLR